MQSPDFWALRARLLPNVPGRVPFSALTLTIEVRAISVFDGCRRVA
jgi:hypothetical protein